MREAKSRDRRIAFVALVAAFALLGALAAGCSATTQKPSPNLGIAPGPSAPAPIDLTSPEGAVRSYLDRISAAYRVLDSQIASATATDEENVRIDSYVELNRQKNQAIDQKLTSISLKVSKSGANKATVTAKETWTYRYLDPSTQAYTTPPLKAAYDSTYTVTRGANGLWRVAEVKAVPLGQVK